jgi:hypothetical protein
MHSEAWPKVVRLLHAVVQADFQIESLELIETRCVTVRLKILFPLDDAGSAVTPLQLRPVFGAVSSRVSPGDTMSRFVGFGDKSWVNSKNFFQTQGLEFLFLSQRARRDAFGGSIAPKTPVLKLKHPLACKPPAAIVNESTLVAFEPFAKPQVAGLRYRQEKGVVSGGFPVSRRAGWGFAIGAIYSRA